MKSFAIIALLGVAQAISCVPACGGDCQSVDGTGKGYRASLSRGASVPCGGGVGTLTTQLAGSATSIGAQKIVVPDKQTVTDQAKVSKTCSQAKKQDQGCAVSKRSFTVNGGIKITQKGENTSKGASSASHCGEQASQSKETESVRSNTCAPASLPSTEGDVNYDQSQCAIDGYHYKNSGCC